MNRSIPPPNPLGLDQDLMSSHDLDGVPLPQSGCGVRGAEGVKGAWQLHVLTGKTKSWRRPNLFALPASSPCSSAGFFDLFPGSGEGSGWCCWAWEGTAFWGALTHAPNSAAGKVDPRPQLPCPSPSPDHTPSCIGPSWGDVTGLKAEGRTTSSPAGLQGPQEGKGWSGGGDRHSSGPPSGFLSWAVFGFRPGQKPPARLPGHPEARWEPAACLAVSGRWVGRPSTPPLQGLSG